MSSAEKIRPLTSNKLQSSHLMNDRILIWCWEFCKIALKSTGYFENCPWKTLNQKSWATLEKQFRYFSLQCLDFEGYFVRSIDRKATASRDPRINQVFSVSRNPVKMTVNCRCNRGTLKNNKTRCVRIILSMVFLAVNLKKELKRRRVM